MNTIFKKSISFLILIFLISSCASVEKYNIQATKKHAPENIKEDIDYAYKKLKKLHPDLYLYISKDSLDNKFYNYKKSINKSLTSKEFYNQFSPIIKSIKQGHTSINPPQKKQLKKEIKLKGRRKNPFLNIEFKNIDTKVIVNKYYLNDEITSGSELLKIDNKDIESLIKNYKKLHTGDGYNNTFIDEFTRKYIGYFYTKTTKLTDSIKLTLSFKDSLYSKYIRAYPKKNTKPKSTDTIKKLSKAEKKLLKLKQKKRFKWKQKYGYSRLTKQKTRNFEFIKLDTTNTNKSIGYLKIRGFSNGPFKEFYEETFSKLDSAKSDYLIIDLRDNLGGRLKEISNLYSYLTNEDFVFVKPAKMTKASNRFYPLTHSKSFLKKSLSALFYPVFKINQIIKVKNIEGEPHYQFKESKIQKPNLSHNYTGKIYVLINGLSFSSSCVISNNLKANNRAFFVGDETGGAYNSTIAGIFAPIVLPNSGLNLNFGLMSLETHNKTEPDGYGIKPDKYIKVTSFSKDEQLDWILNDIKSKHKN